MQLCGYARFCLVTNILEKANSEKEQSRAESSYLGWQQYAASACQQAS